MLSERLKEIARLIEKDKVVFDVGSDHALLPCFLLENGICSKVYAGEVADGPYKRVKETVKKYHYEGRLIPVFSDGLENAPEDVQVVIIAGMGFYTIKHILDNCDVNRYEYFIVQSNTDVDLLRQYICDKRYTIEDESIVKDGFYYQIVRFSGKRHRKYSDLQIKYGPINLKKKDELFIDYLKSEKKRLEEVNERANKEEYRRTIEEIDGLLVYNVKH